METVGNENSLSKDTDSQDNDLVLKLKKLTDRVALHETEKQKMRDEFGQQRAKMKELFLQKEEELKKESTEHDHLKELIKKLEAELNESRTQLTVVSLQLEGQLEEERRRFQDEVASLQQLITETVDESIRNEDQVKKLWRLNEKLEVELDELRHCSPAGETVTGSGAQLLTAPTAMISTLARRVVSQLGADSSVNAATSDSLEESMRKVNKYAQEDAEVLRSLVIPLEEEIRALKDKLRYTDEKLRKYEQNSEQDSSIEQFAAASCEAVINVVGGTNKEGSDNSTSKIVISTTDASASSPIDVAAGSSPISDVTVTAHPGSSLVCDDSTKLIPDFCCAGTGEISSAENDENSRQRLIEMNCSKCTEYESRLVMAQEKCSDLEKQIAALERSKEELAKEGLIRKDMEQKWNEKKEIHKAEVLELQERVKDAHSALKDTRELFKTTRTQVTEELNRLTNERRNVQLQLDRLQMENENLIGKRNANARQLQDEVINLPDNVEELQVMLLKCREDLISARVGQEAAEQQVATLKEKAQLQRYQTQAENQTRQQLNNTLTTEVESLKSQLHKSDMARHQSQLVIQRLNNEEKNMRLEIEDLNMQLVSTCNAKKLLEDQVSELKSSLSSLQTELHNSEIVQKDFVRLSQSLQQELERIRSSHTQVRWEHEDDVEQCPGCRQSFSVTRRKQHCRHCGRVFCVACLTHTVLSGPNQRPSKVCDVCHTLLVEDTAPYFSTEPPYSNN